MAYFGCVRKGSSPVPPTPPEPNYLYKWDFTKDVDPLVDEIHGQAAELQNGATISNQGVSINGVKQTLRFYNLGNTDVSNRNITIKIEFGTIEKTYTSGHGRFIMWNDDTGFIYRSTGQWQLYKSSWRSTTTVTTDANIFSNSTAILNFNKGVLSVFKDTTKIIDDVSDITHLFHYIGSYGGQSFYNVIVKKIEIYENEEV